MDVTAYKYGAGTKVELGKIADSIWTQGFKFMQSRTIQVSKPINALAPNLFDRLTKLTDFSFAAGRSFSGGRAIAEALQFVGSHADDVPTVADLQFATQGGEIWLNYCGIVKVELVEKRSALVVFGYTITGGTWGTKRA